MLKLPLSEFIQGDYPDRHDVGVYVVKNGEPLYVGMSRDNIWNRWFSSRHGHLLVTGDGTVTPRQSRIGGVICEQLPASLDWTIELWSADDCQELFADDIARLGWLPDRVNLAAYEQMMIRRLQPTLNVLS